MRYVSSKALKRMNSFQFKNLVGDQRPKLLLPLSGGPSSLAMLEVLDAQLQRQLDKQNRKAYDLILMHVQGLNPAELEQATKWREDVMALFPSHRFLEIMNMQDIFGGDDRVERDLEQLGLHREVNENNAALLTRLFASTSTATARADLEEVLKQRLILAVAKGESCQCILWGHSDSRLAAKALADVAKGRGGSVPNFMADGPSPFGLDFNHPMRDLFRSELELYLTCLQKDISSCLSQKDISVPAPVSVRNTSIDDLLTGYIDSQGEKYPSIMANVVRTASKLQAPTKELSSNCKLCIMPITSNGSMNLCYGCTRMKQDIKI